jgi:hypothetical protein
MQSDFAWIDELVRNGNTDSAFDALVERFRQEKQYRRVFDARLMQTRLQLGLPLVSQPTLADLEKETQCAYQDASVRAAREVGELFLADGDVAAAWPYFRAVGDTEPIAAALERYDLTDLEIPDAQDRLGAAIQIAFQEGVHPRKGFELILKHYGLCRAITMFSAYPQRDGRHESLCLLVRSLHAQLVDNLTHAISDVEGLRPESRSIAALIEGRDWLFENNAQYTDSSHLAPVLALSAELEDKETLQLAVEIADYASRLGPLFQYSDDPPFERVYEDRGIYLRALLGEEVERALKHFDDKAARFPVGEYGPAPAEVLVNLLIRLQRYDAAIDAYRRYLEDVPADDLSCPSLSQICQMAGDYDRLKNIAREQGDKLSYMAGALQQRSAT